jgi:hypothetical protein
VVSSRGTSTKALHGGGSGGRLQGESSGDAA